MIDVVAVAAVKALGTAKSRLAAAAPPARHSRHGAEPGVADLVLAMLADTVADPAATDGVRAVYVVSPDPDVHATALRSGAHALGEPDGGGLNAALAAGAATVAAAHPDASVLAIQPDLPALTSAELAAFLAAAGKRRAFVPDREGTGTAALLAPVGTALDPRFGAGSAGRHRDSGALELAGPWPGLRGDVDTAVDLRAVAHLLGTHTATALRARSAS
ncbi:2-phospho-L-lactate guanylyltransferase [Tsukamurella soli]|uniref:Phosphoenolpyruvate guanylyltransferase n=1 Tax=Tsukamurella soli TaxID=644556 RepID=A0ABP8JVP2_9ACTN